MNYTIDHKAETILVTITCDISNKRYFSLSFHTSVIVNKFEIVKLKFGSKAIW